MKKIILVTLSLFALTLSSVKAQSMYDFAAGGRIGYPNGITAKLFLSDVSAVEGIAHVYFGSGLGVTALYEYHINIFQTPALNAFFGGGASFTAYNGSVANVTPYSAVGIEGIAGVEYTFEDFPLNISIDIKPTFNFVGITGVSPFLPSAGASARYVFKY